MDFLPVSMSQMQELGWDCPDFVYVIGDAYVDHPSFGPAIISRVLEQRGYKVAIISQPDWKNEASITTFGLPRLGFLVSGGNMDSMVNHYSVSKKRRKTDAYTPGGVIGKRPDYATVVYCNLIRKVYKDVPIVIGGIEASLRRLAHYDYWSDKVKRSILLDSQADLISYGMGEHSIVEIADALAGGIPIRDLTFVRGTAYRTRTLDPDRFMNEYEMLPSYEEICADKKRYAESFMISYENCDAFSAKTLVEPYGSGDYIVINPPAYPLTQMEMDDVYALPYTRKPHPCYDAIGKIPAIEEIRFSITSVRGCFGACSFCALTFHQGRIIQARSQDSIIEEAIMMTKDPEFKGYIHDVGGPTANFRQPACEKQMTYGACVKKQCLFPSLCKNMIVDHSDYISLLRRLRKVPGVKKVFIRSGIRFDYLLADQDETFFRELCKYHVSGQLKVAPEHVSDRVLKLMGKPGNDVYRKFCTRYEQINKEEHLDQYLVPYLMSSHPGSGLEDAIELAEYLKRMHLSPEQVQDFYPTPATISTCMYYTGLDPRTMKPVYVARNPHEKAMQRALIQFRRSESYDLVKEALKIAHREDLIGFGPDCLIPPRKMENGEKQSGNRDHHSSEKKKGLSKTSAIHSVKKQNGQNRHKSAANVANHGRRK